MSAINRKTKVVSVSLDPKRVKELDRLCELTSQSRSSAISELVRKAAWMKEWDQLRLWGRGTAKKLGITSEEDVYKLLGDA